MRPGGKEALGDWGGMGGLRGGTTWAGTRGLTKLLNGTVCAPRQLQGHVYPAPLVLDPAVGLEGDAGAGGLRDDGHKLGVGMGWDRVLGAAFSLFSSGSPGSLPSRVQAHTPSPHLVAIP